MGGREQELERLVAEIRACRKCSDDPAGDPLPHEPRPVLCVSRSARILISGQAPGTRVHASGVPFSDPSGVRLRSWLDVTEDEFYDTSRVAILPMGFCFPGHDAHGGDLPPRRECAPLWRARVLKMMPNVELMLLVGHHAQHWHLRQRAAMTEVVRNWRALASAPGTPRIVPLPHPSWRNNAWLKANPWFEAELQPWLAGEVRRLLEGGKEPRRAPRRHRQV